MAPPRVRRRYIAFVAEGGALVPPAALLEARALDVAARTVGRAAQQRVKPRVFVVRPGAGILRVDHHAQAATVAQLDGLAVGDARVRTVTTSGTLRQAKAALGVRQSARRRRPVAKRAAPQRPADGAGVPRRGRRGGAM